jgi:hypothetical protein
MQEIGPYNMFHWSANPVWIFLPHEFPYKEWDLQLIRRSVWPDRIFVGIYIIFVPWFNFCSTGIYFYNTKIFKLFLLVQFLSFPSLSWFQVCTCILPIFIVHFPVTSYWQTLISGAYITVVILRCFHYNFSICTTKSRSCMTPRVEPVKYGHESYGTQNQ